MSRNFKPQIVLRDGRPDAVLLPLREYERLLDLAEDAEDAREIRRLSRKRQKLITFEQYLARRH